MNQQRTPIAQYSFTDCSTYPVFPSILSSDPGVSAPIGHVDHDRFIANWLGSFQVSSTLPSPFNSSWANQSSSFSPAVRCDVINGIYVAPDDETSNEPDFVHPIVESSTASIQRFHDYFRSKVSTVDVLSSLASKNIPEAFSNETWEYSDAASKSLLGLSIALWIRPAIYLADKSSVPQIQPILTLGSRPSESNLAPKVKTYAMGSTDYRSEAADMEGCDEYEVLIGQYGDFLYLSYSDDDPAQSCHVVLVRSKPLTGQRLTQVVITWSIGETSVYIDGVPIIGGSSRNSTDLSGDHAGIPNYWDPSLSNWDWDAEKKGLQNAPPVKNKTPAIHSASWQMLKNFHSPNTFQGSILELAFFDVALTAAQASAMFVQGVGTPPSSYAIAVNAPTSSVSVPQDMRSGPLTIPLTSLNTSVTGLDLFVEILSVPQHGFLTYRENNTNAIALHIGSRIQIPLNHSSVNVTYTLPSNSKYFNVPDLDVYGNSLRARLESIAFRIGALSDDHTTVLASSSPALQQIDVIRVNHAPVFEIQANHPVWATVPGDPLCLQLNGTIRLREDDEVPDLDYVRVDVWGTHGAVSLSPGQTSQLDFESCAFRTSSEWQCVGDGDQDRNMTFVGAPSSIVAALEGLTYYPYSTKLHQSDHKVVVRVSDGEGGACLSTDEHKEYGATARGPNRSAVSVYGACFQVAIEISVPASLAVAGVESLMKENMGHVDVADVLFWFLAVMVVACMCCGLKKCCRCPTSRRSVAPAYFTGSPGINVSMGCDGIS
jgi:hypothetical protein